MQLSTDIYGVCAVILFLVASVASGCTTPVESPRLNESTNSTNFGFRSDLGAGGGPAISFREAVTSVYELRPGSVTGPGANISSGNQILYAKGIGLNSEGEAAAWVFIVSSTNRTYVITYDTKGTSIADWKGASPKREIRPESLLSPKDLFRLNRQAVFGDGADNQTVSRDLVLSMNTYTLTVSGMNEKRVMVFDAETGAPLRSNG